MSKAKKILEKTSTLLGEAKGKPLKTDLVAYPNMMMSSSQKRKLKKGTNVYIVTDFSKQNLIKFDAEGETLFVRDSDYFSAV